MKCPKCGYVSFDYNQVCPKCNKDISAERDKMNLPSYKPTPSFISGREAKGAGVSSAEQEAGFGAEETIELKFSSSRDLNKKAEYDNGESVDLLGPSPQETEQEGAISFDLDDFSVSKKSGEDLDASASTDEEKDAKLSLDLEDLDLDLNLGEPADKSS